MKLMIYLVVGLAVGLGGGTAWKALEVKSEVEAAMVAAADSARADSLAVAGADDEHPGDRDDEAGADPTEPEEPAADSADADASPADGEEAAVDVQLALADGDTAAAAPVEQPGEDAVGDTATAPAEDGDEGVDGLAGDAPPAGQPAVTDEGARRLARVFGAMRASDAARVLAELSDPEVEAILIKLGDRQAGQILSTFPPDRAANLSRRVLGRNGGEQ